MSHINFEYFAIQYLNSWFRTDQSLVKRVCSSDKNESRNGLIKAATKYKVIRNLLEIDEPKRFHHVKKILDGTKRPTVKIVDEIVIECSNKLEKKYIKSALSASSKLLWMKYKSPIVIYDYRARVCLKKLNYQNIDGDYTAFRSAWRKEFFKNKKQISACCESLYKVKNYSLAYDIHDEKIKKLTSKKWFHERVFDKYLWENGD